VQDGERLGWQHDPTIISVLFERDRAAARSAEAMGS